MLSRARGTFAGIFALAALHPGFEASQAPVEIAYDPFRDYPRAIAGVDIR